jgi:hypothetical protein
MLTENLASQLGNTDLPEESPDLTQPESVSLDLLKTLHHVLLEVRSHLCLGPTIYSPKTLYIDCRRRR